MSTFAVMVFVSWVVLGLLYIWVGPFREFARFLITLPFVMWFMWRTLHEVTQSVRDAPNIIERKIAEDEEARG